MSEEQEKPEKKKSTVKRFFVEVFLFILVAVVAAGGVFVLAKQKPEVLGLSSASSEEREVEQLVGLVGKLIDLPPDEAPTIATVTDEQKAREQKFFQKTKNGDKVLVYSKAGKAILYRPSDNKIIEVGQLNALATPATIVEATPEPTATAIATPQTFNVSIFNGTQNKDLMTSVESRLKSSNQQANIIEKENALKHDYAESFVVDVSGQHPELAELVASVFDIKVKELPEAERTPLNAAQVVIIAGSDLIEE